MYVLCMGFEANFIGMFSLSVSNLITDTCRLISSLITSCNLNFFDRTHLHELFFLFGVRIYVFIRGRDTFDRDLFVHTASIFRR